jgi:hypothetical protein
MKNLKIHPPSNFYAEADVKPSLTRASLASNMDTSTKYIQDHYYHHETEELTAELNPAKRTKKMTADEMFTTYHRPESPPKTP